MIFRENKDFACTHGCVPRATRCELKMLSLPHAYLAALWTLAWVTLGWRANGILTWSPAQGWRRHRIEGSENPQNLECPLLHFQEVIFFSPLEVSHSRMRSVKKMLQSVVLQENAGGLRIVSPGLACLTFNTRLSHRGSETELQGWMAAGADTPG